MITLEDILHKYKFLAKSKKAFLNNPRWDEDGYKNTMTVDGGKAYSKLIALIYDLGELIDADANDTVEDLDNIVNDGGY